MRSWVASLSVGAVLAAAAFAGPAGADDIRLSAAVVPPCAERSDTFTGAALDTQRWSTIVREDPNNYRVDGGDLVLPTTSTDLYGTNNTGTPNIILQPLPAGGWEATAHLTVPARVAYQQAGLIVYGDDDNYGKMVLQARDTAAPNAAARVFQFVREEAGAPNETTSSNTAPLGAAYPDAFWVRLTSDGSNLTASYSADGQTFTPMPQTKSLAGITNPRIGVVALAGTGRPVIEANFHEFAFDPEPVCTVPDTTPPGVTASVAGDGSPQVTVTLSADDAGSGVASVEYRVGNGAWQTYTAPLVLEQPGTSTLAFRATDVDGNVSDQATVTFTVAPIVSGDGGGPTTASTGGNATAEEPAQATITSPGGGALGIRREPVDAATHDRLVLLDAQFRVDAPPANPATPLVLELRLHHTLLGEGDDETSLRVLRDGVVVAECGGSSVADPDPCITARQRSGDQLRLTILTSRASTWNVALPKAETPVDDKPCDDVADSDFTDVAPDSVHKPAIDCARLLGITQGLTPARYAPRRAVSRDQMASFVANTVRAAGGSLPAGPSGFVDVAGNVHEANIAALTQAAIVTGTSSRRFWPGQTVSRDQMASTLVAAYEYVTGAPLPSGPDAFDDDDGSVHEAAIDRAVAAGLVTGLGGSRFAPGSPVSRDQMASMLARVVTAASAAG